MSAHVISQLLLHKQRRKLLLEKGKEEYAQKGGRAVEGSSRCVSMHQNLLGSGCVVGWHAASMRAHAGWVGWYWGREGRRCCYR